MSRQLGKYHIPVFLICGVAAVLHVFANMGKQSPGVFIEVFDDALMFVRYADNVLAGHGLVWNVGGEPAYGATSLTHTFVSAAARRFAPDLLPTYFIQRVAVAYLALFMTASAWVLYRLNRGASGGRRALTALFWLAVVFSSLLLFHSRSGMDTNLALVHFLLFLYLYYRLAEAPSMGRALGAAVLGAAFFITRPDLLLFAGMLPLVLWLRDRRNKYFFMAGLASGVLLLLILLAVRLYFGHFLPLPFYVKSLYWKPRLDHNLINFVWFLKDPAVLLMLFLCVIRGRRLAGTPFGLACLAAVVPYFIYFMFFSNQNMGMGGRFYFPLFALLFIHAALVVRDFTPWERFKKWTARVEPYGAYLVPGVLLIGSLMIFSRVGADVKRAAAKQVRFESYESFFRASHDVYMQLYSGTAAGKSPDGRNSKQAGKNRAASASLPAELVNMPAHCVVAGSEMGLTGVAFARHHLIDILGLNSKLFVFSRGRGQIELLMDAKPDVLFMPHQDYEGLNKKLLAHPVFQSDYVGISPRDGVLPMGLAFRKTGRCWPHLRGVLEKTGVHFDKTARVFPDLKSLQAPFKQPGALR